MARTKGKQVYLCPGYMAQHIETLRDGRVLLTAEREAISAVPLAVAAAVPLEMLKIVSIVLSGGTVSTEEKIQAHTWVRELVGWLAFCADRSRSCDASQTQKNHGNAQRSARGGTDEG